jgi:hypothetical protein
MMADMQRSACADVVFIYLGKRYHGLGLFVEKDLQMTNESPFL